MLRIIGRGSYGEVWLARNVMGVLRAVKCVHRERFESERPYEREFSGLQAYEPLSRTCDGLVQVLHVGRRGEAGCFYSVMELADDAGGIGAEVDPELYQPRTLRSDLARLSRLPVSECVEIGRSLATGLAQLHRHRLVHRDLKPSNVIFVGGRAKLADIGLVAGLGEARSFVGTEGYVPPEGPGRPTADLFALGRLLYQAATGLPPERFPEIPSDWIDAPNARELMEFHEILLKLGEGDVRRRYQNAEEVLADLALLQSGKSLVELRTLHRRLVWFRRFGVASAVGLALVAVAWSWAAREARRERESARRISVAEVQARRELVNSTLSQAQAEVRVGGLGARDAVLRLLTHARSLGPDADQRRRIRSAAVAALVQTGTRWTPAPRSLRSTDPMSVAGDRRQEVFARREPNGSIRIFRAVDSVGSVVMPALSPMEDEIQGFSPDGAILRVRRGREFILGNVASAAYFRTNGACAFSPLGGVWIAGNEGAVDWLELPSGRLRRRLLPLEVAAVGASIAQLAVSPEGEWVAVSAGDERVQLREVDSPGKGESLTVSGAVHALAWGPRSGQLAVGTESGEVRLWQLPDPHARRELAVRTGAIRRMAFDPSGRVLAVAGEDEVVTLFDVGTGREIARVSAIAWQLEFRADETRLGLVWRGGEPGFIDLVPPVGFRLLRGRSSAGGEGALAFSPDGNWLAAGTASGIEIRSTRTWETTASIPSGSVQSLAFGESGKRLWWLDPDGVGSVAMEAGQPRELAIRREPQSDVTHLAATASGTALVMARGTADALSVRAEGRPEVRLGPHEFVRFAALSESGDRVASGSQSVPDVLVWTVDSSRPVVRIPSGLQVRPVFSPDGQWLATAGPACSLWRAKDWAPGPALPSLPANTVRGFAAFSPDSRTLAAVYGDHEIHLFHLPDATPGLVLESPEGVRIVSLAFSPDGTTLLASTVRGEVLSWQLRELDSALVQLGLEE